MTALAISIGIVLGVLIFLFIVMVVFAIVNHYHEGTELKWLRDLAKEDDEFMFIEPQKHGPMKFPCPTWDGFSCNCSPVLSCQEPPDKNCFTLPNGECVSEKPCMHTPPTSVVYP